MKILSRYVLKEHVGPFMFAATALTSIMLLQYIARRFGDLVGKGLPWQMIGKFFILSLPFTVAMTLPMAVLVAVLYAFSRLAAENEITAMRAGGVSTRRLLVPVLGAGVALAVLMLGFNDQILPRANHQLAVLQMDIFRAKPTFALREQVINTVKEGQLYLRAEHLDEGSSGMRGVEIYDPSDPTRRRTIYADSGYLQFAPNQRDLQMFLFDGVMQTVPTDSAGELTRIFFVTNRMRVPEVANGPVTASTADSAAKGDREMTVCEMQNMLTREDFRTQRAQHDLDEAMRPDKPLPAEIHGPLPPPPKFEGPGGIGAVYCKLLGIFAVSTAEAATVSPPQQSARGMSDQDSARVIQARDVLEEARHARNRYSVEIQKKFSLAATCIIFVLVGAPIALRFPRGGVGLVLGVSFLIFAIYYVGLIGGEALANKDIVSPVLAMWAANIIFLLVGVYGVLHMGRESATSRGGDLREMYANARSWFARMGRRAGIPLERRRRI